MVERAAKTLHGTLVVLAQLLPMPRCREGEVTAIKTTSVTMREKSHAGSVGGGRSCAGLQADMRRGSHTQWSDGSSLR
jgi:hypothetical protein